VNLYTIKLIKKSTGREKDLRYWQPSYDKGESNLFLTCEEEQRVVAETGQAAIDHFESQGWLATKITFHHKIGAVVGLVKPQEFEPEEPTVRPISAADEGPF
jgi:hypothetical protein